MEDREDFIPEDKWETLRKKVTRLVVVVPEQCQPNSFGYAVGRKTINGIMELFREFVKDESLPL